MDTKAKEVLHDSTATTLFRECKFVEGIDEPTNAEDLEALLEYEGRFTVGIAVNGEIVTPPVHLPPVRILDRKKDIKNFFDQITEEAQSEDGVSMRGMCKDNRGEDWSGTLLVAVRARLIQLFIAAGLIDMPAGEIRGNILYLADRFRLAKR